jgi:GNAT superfamily N-acetyltransferase
VSLDYGSICPKDYEPIREFLCENGWAHRVSDPLWLVRMIQGTDRTVVAWDAGRVVGFARALCDGVSNGYLSIVAVAEDKRGLGIGRELVRRLTGDDLDITWTLRAGRGNEGFWEKMGFAASETAMERTRRTKCENELS